MTEKTILLVSPHGFCAGVERAIALADRLLAQPARPVYCLNQIVHNGQIIDDLTSRGMIFVGAVSEIPRGASVLFSAHGVSPAVREEAAARNLKTVDATCPFVTKVHREVKRFAAQGYTILLIGHRKHDEIVGVAGEAPDRVAVIENEEEARHVQVPDPAKVAAMTQTTLSIDDAARLLSILRQRFPLLQTPRERDICYATRNRQQAVRDVAHRVDAFIVIGARNSSNSNRLAEVARLQGAPAYLVSTLDELDALSLDDVGTLGLTAGASTPESMVREAVAGLRSRGFTRLEEVVTAEEDMHFTIPEA